MQRALSRRPSLVLPLLLVLAGCESAPADPVDAGALDARVRPDAGPPDCDLEPLYPGCTPEEPPAPELSAAVEIVRDDMGVPHLFAATDSDAMFASGYMQATDRLFQMELTRRRAYGTRAEVLGEGYVDSDRTIRVMNIAHWGRVNAALMLRQDPDTYALVQAWVAGVNRRIEEVRDGEAPRPYGLGEAELDLVPEPWTVADAFTVGKLILFGNAGQIEYDILATVIRDYVSSLEGRLPLLAPIRDVHTLPPEERPEGVGMTLAPSTPPEEAPTPPAELAAGLMRLHERLAIFPRGASNNWAIDGSHTANGRPLIAGDPHQGLGSPSLMWMQHMHSAAADGLDVVGFNFVGTPSVQLGHNAHVAWTATTTYPDYMDLWAVRQIGDEIVLGDERLPIVMRREEIRVRGEAEPRVVMLEDVPGHGVLLPADFIGDVTIGIGRRLLFGWVGFAPTHEALGFARFDRARTLEEFEAAADIMEIGAFNFVAASAEGIAYRSSPRVPIRVGAIGPGRLPYALLDGDDAGSLWSGDFLPQSMLPHSRGGARGWIATANNEPYGLVGDGSAVGDPFYFGVYFDPGTRAARIEEEITRLVAERDGGITVEDMQVLQDDSHSEFADDLVPALIEAWDARASDASLAAYRDREDLALLVELLRGWDRRMERDAAAPVVFDAYAFYLAGLVLEDDMSVVFQPILSASSVFMLKFLSLVITGRIEAADSFLQEGRTLLLVRALERAAVFVTERFGGVGPAEHPYTWGDFHGTRFAPIWSEPGSERLDGGWTPTDGGDGTVNVSDSQFFSGGAAVERLESDSGAIYRLTARIASDGVPEAFVNVPRGVSGDPDSRHFDDLHTDWQAHVYRPLLFRRADLEADCAREGAVCETTTLAP